MTDSNADYRRKERAKEIWHWNREVKGDDHPDTKRALREMQEANSKPTGEEKP